MEAYKTLDTVLVKLFNDIMDIEEKAIITEEFKDISNNDMHIIAAVGEHGAKSMSADSEDPESDSGDAYHSRE